MEAPKGCVITLVGPTGATFVGYDFDSFRPGGFALKSTQQSRANDKLCREFMKQSCSVWLHNAFDVYDIAQVIDKLVQQHGWKKAVTFIGH